MTAANGTFEIPGVDPDLLFQLVAVHDGFQPAFINKVDPLSGSATAVVITARFQTMSVRNVVRGHVVDDLGRPLRTCVVEPLGISTMETWQGKTSEASSYGRD